MRDVYAARAARAYAAMQRSFRKRSGLYRRDGAPRLIKRAAHLWPFARALVSTLDMAGIGDGLVDQVDLEGAIEEDLAALAHYWDTERHPPAYSSDVLGSHLGGDRYYDDNAWVALGLVQLERLRPGSGYLARAEELFQFAQAGWGSDRTPNPGGVYWVEQGRGRGTRNHDRNTVSTAPNAELGLHVTELRKRDGRQLQEASQPGPTEMYEWVVATLDESAGSEVPGTGLYWDKLQGDGSVDRTIWSYNQGSMVGLNVLLARSDPGERTEYLSRAEAITRKSLERFAEDYESQPAAFNAIFFRNLLLLHAVTGDEALRTAVIDAMRGYVDRLWSERRDRRYRFHIPKGGVTLLNQSAMVQLLALLAWDPDAYGRLA